MPKPVASTIYLHIGTQKTGTTTLQTVGRTNRAALAKRGILYPESPGTTNHIGLTLFATGGVGSRDLMRDAGLHSADEAALYQAALPARLRAEFTASGCKKVWLSNEHLSSRVRHAQQLVPLADMLAEPEGDGRVDERQNSRRAQRLNARQTNEPILVPAAKKKAAPARCVESGDDTCARQVSALTATPSD